MSSLPTAFSAEAQIRFNGLVAQYARTVAHEANNLLFLQEIAAETARAVGDPRPALRLLRKQARLVAVALAPGKPRAAKISDLVDDLIEAIAGQSSLGTLLEWIVAPSAGRLSLRERPGHTQLLLQHLIEEAALARDRKPAQQAPDRLLRVHFDGGEDGIDVELTVLSGQPLPAPTALARELCALNTFGLAPEVGGLRLRLWLPLAE